jgi:hypothetical protein
LTQNVSEIICIALVLFDAGLTANARDCEFVNAPRALSTENQARFGFVRKIGRNHKENHHEKSFQIVCNQFDRFAFVGGVRRGA